MRLDNGYLDNRPRLAPGVQIPTIAELGTQAVRKVVVTSPHHVPRLSQRHYMLFIPAVLYFNFDLPSVLPTCHARDTSALDRLWLPPPAGGIQVGKQYPNWS